MGALKVLDVTLRDGGCVNNFNFGQTYMEKILSAQEESGVDYIEMGYIDDQKYAENFALYKKNKGKNALRFELKMKGVDDEIINAVLKKIESQKDVIFTLAQKFLKNKKPAPDLKQKLFRHLASKGFEFEEINLVITEIFKEQKWKLELI